MKNDAKTIYLLISGDKVVGKGKLRGWKKAEIGKRLSRWKEMCDRENDYRVGENCRLQSFLFPPSSPRLPNTRDYTCVTQRRKALLFCCVLTTWLLKVASERGRWKRVKGNYVRCRDNERSILREETRMFVYRESEAFSDNWEFRWTRWKKEVEVNVNWGDVNGVETILHNIFKINIGTNNGN